MIQQSNNIKYVGLNNQNIDGGDDNNVGCCDTNNQNIIDGHMIHRGKYGEIAKQSVAQQPTLLSNMGRMSTITRYLVEKGIGHITNRYSIFRRPLIGSEILNFNCIIRYIKNTHIQFKVGQITTNKNRFYIYLFMVMNLNSFPDTHPIPYHFVLSCLENKSM